MSDASEAALEALAAKRLRIGVILTVAELIVYFGFILLVAFNKAGLSELITRGAERRHPSRRPRHRRHVGTDLDLHGLGQPSTSRDPPLRRREEMTPGSNHARRTSAIAIVFFFLFIVSALGITTGRRAGRARPSSSSPPAARSPAAERLRARRRLHERGELPRHRRPRRALRLRRPDLLGRLAGGLAGRDVPDRRAAAQPRQVHLRRRGRLPAAADARCASPPPSAP